MPKSTRGRKAVHWFLTINNYGEEDYSGFCNADGTLAPHLKYLMLGKHVGEKRKVPHIHAVVWMKSRKRLSAMKKLFPRANIKERKGTIEECAVYLNKENEMKEWGTRPKELGERNKDNWAAAVLAAKEDRLEDIPPHMYAR